MTTRWRRACNVLVRPREPDPAALAGDDEPDPWRRAQEWAIDWQVHLEEGELRLELARQRMRAAVLAEERVRVIRPAEAGESSGEGCAE